MIIVLEGADGTGKTTLAEFLQDNLNAHYIHLTYRFKKNMFVYHTWAIWKAFQLIIDTGRPVIIDRWWISEQIYAKVFRKGSKWLFMDRMLDRMLLRAGGIYIYCDSGNLRQYAKHFDQLKNSRKEMYENTIEVAKEYKAFDWSRFKGHMLKYNWQIDGNNLPEFLIKVLFAMNDNDICHIGLKSSNLKVQNLGGHIVKSNVLFVGDCVNKKGRNISWPFFEYGNSSLYFAKALKKYGILEKYSCFINIRQEDGYDMIKEWVLIHENKNPVVCLGKIASDIFKKIFPEVKFTELPHPQAARRFPKVDRIFKRKLSMIKEKI